MTETINHFIPAKTERGRVEVMKQLVGCLEGNPLLGVRILRKRKCAKERPENIVTMVVGRKGIKEEEEDKGEDEALTAHEEDHNKEEVDK